jgi:peptidoglycan-associated lipoprotein
MFVVISISKLYQTNKIYIKKTNIKEFIIMIKTINTLAVAFCALFLLAGCSTGYNKKGGVSAAETSLAADFEKHAGDRVHFDFDSAALSHNAKLVLEKQVAWLKAHPHVKATIEGHCDERGPRDYNLGLGERRAEATKHFLHHHGIDTSRLDTISYGKERPAVVGNNEEAWQQNRRAVTAIK